MQVLLFPEIILVKNKPLGLWQNGLPFREWVKHWLHERGYRGFCCPKSLRSVLFGSLCSLTMNKYFRVITWLWSPCFPHNTFLNNGRKGRWTISSCQQMNNSSVYANGWPVVLLNLVMWSVTNLISLSLLIYIFFFMESTNHHKIFCQSWVFTGAKRCTLQQ